MTIRQISCLLAVTFGSAVFVAAFAPGASPSVQTNAPSPPPTANQTVSNSQSASRLGPKLDAAPEPSLVAALPSGDPASATPTPMAPPIASYEDLGRDQWIAAIKRVVEVSGRIVTSPAFRDHLSTLQLLTAPNASSAIGGADVAKLYLGLSNVRPYPTSYRPTWGRFLGIGKRQVAPCGADPFVRGSHQTASTSIGPHDEATTFLNSCTFARAAKNPEASPPDLEEFACAINTITHEWTHTIPTADDATEIRFLDHDHKQAAGMLVSYTVGAVAQCTYLDTPPSHVTDFEKCVKTVGTTYFNATTCRPGWLKRSGLGGSLSPATNTGVH